MTDSYAALAMSAEPLLATIECFVQRLPISTEYRVISVRGEHFSRRKGNRGLIIEATVTSEHINIQEESGGWGGGMGWGGGGADVEG